MGAAVLAGRAGGEPAGRSVQRRHHRARADVGFCRDQPRRGAAQAGRGAAAVRFPLRQAGQLCRADAGRGRAGARRVRLLLPPAVCGEPRPPGVGRGADARDDRLRGLEFLRLERLCVQHAGRQPGGEPLLRRGRERRPGHRPAGGEHRQAVRLQLPDRRESPDHQELGRGEAGLLLLPGEQGRQVLLWWACWRTWWAIRC